MTRAANQSSPAGPPASGRVEKEKPEMLRPRRRTPKWLLPALIAVSLGLTAFAVLRPKGPNAPAVNVVTAKTDTLVKTVTGTGTAKAEVSRNVSFPGGGNSGGNVASVNVRVGDSVQAGQVLARLDTAAMQRDLEAARVAVSSAQADVTRAQASAREGQLDVTRQAQAARAALSAAQASLSEAQRTLTLQQQLLQAGAASQQDVRTAQAARDDAQRKVTSAQNDLNYAQAKGTESGVAAVEQARSALETARVRVQNLEKSLADAELRAPTAGVVSAVNITVGNPATQNALEITDPARLYLEVPFDETRAASVSVGQPATVQFDALPNRTLNGTVDRVEPVARSSGQVASVLVRIRLPDARDVKPGFTASTTVTTRRLRDVVTVPLETTTEVGGKTQVWRVTPEGQAQMLGKAAPVTVTVLDRNANLAAVQGLKSGHLVVTPAPTDLSEGAAVKFTLPSADTGDGAGGKAGQSP